MTLGNNVVQFKEDEMERLYQEGAAARAEGQAKSPYPNEPFKELYWKRGYADAANPPAEGKWLPYAKYTPRGDTFVPTQMKPELFVLLPDGTPLLRLYITPVCRVTTKEMDAFGAHLERLLTENPFEMDARVIEKDPHRMRQATASAAPRAPGGRTARVVDGKVRIPEGATFDDLGEIVVPPRSLDGSSPNAKSFRRTCRAARNAIRALAEEQGRPVSVVTSEMKE